MNENKTEKYLITGGSGMLGTSIATELLENEKDVRILDLIEPDDFLKDVVFIKGNVVDKNVVEQACDGIDVVIHCAAQVWDPSVPTEIFERTNVLGTRNVIDACHHAGIKKLIYSSSIDVVINEPVKPIINGDESLLYPEPMPKNPYPKTKIIAERDILAANGNDLATCSLRLAGLYGPRDKYHLPNFIKLARKKLNVMVGNGSAKFQHCFCGNAAHAHVIAAQKLDLESPIAGNAYFITDYDPENLFDFNAKFIRELGLKPAKKYIPYKIAYFLASLAERMSSKTIFTRFSVASCCVDLTFDGKKAREDLGYIPRYSKEEAFEITLKWFQENLDNF